MNTNGTPENLVAAHPGNVNAVRSGVFSANGRALQPRAQEIADEIMQRMELQPLDRFAAEQLGRNIALIEACDDDIAANGLTNRNGDERGVVKVRARAERNLIKWMHEFGLTPLSRIQLGRAAAEGALALEITRRQREKDIQTLT